MTERAEVSLVQCHIRENTMASLADVVQMLKKEQVRLTRELQRISAALAAFGKTYGNRQDYQRLHGHE